MVPALLVALLLQQAATVALPPAVEGDFVIKDFKFASGETLPELRIHYRTLGTPSKDAQGIVRNAVLIMHGTGGSGAGFANDSSRPVRTGIDRRRAARRFTIRGAPRGRGRS